MRCSLVMMALVVKVRRYRDGNDTQNAQELSELVAPMSESTRQKILGQNVARVYGL